MIDLHLHTTASDGRCSPSDLVQRVDDAGVRVFAVTDHDTVAAHGEAAAAAEAAGLTFVPGIEVTAVWAGRDVHVLGYWVDHQHAGVPHLSRRPARAAGSTRVAAIGRALAYAGAPIDVGPLLDDAGQPSRRLDRPADRGPGAGRRRARAESVQDAFDRLLGEGQPAFVPRTGVPPLEAVREIHAAGGLASLAHPGVSRCDDQIATWARGGLDALEVYHSDHTECRPGEVPAARRATGPGRHRRLRLPRRRRGQPAVARSGDWRHRPARGLLAAPARPRRPPAVMTTDAPLVEFEGVVKDYQALRPLRVAGAAGAAGRRRRRSAASTRSAPKCS